MFPYFLSYALAFEFHLNSTSLDVILLLYFGSY